MNINRQLTSTVMAIDFLEVFKSRPHWPAKEIVEAVREKYSVIIKRSLAYKIKRTAHKKLRGTMKDHYAKIGSYLEALKAVNPNSTFTLVTDPKVTTEPPVFQRLFVCFDVLSSIWMNGCRKIICLDGCFIKTFLGGMILTAIGRDANEQMFPICWVVVEGENNDSWEWFLTEVQSCLGGGNGNGWTLISDQQKGLVNTVAKVFPAAEHRNCARHIFANWHKVHKGDELKEIFWRAVRATCEPDFKDAIEEMKEKLPVAAKAFLAQNTRAFCRSYVKTHTFCEVIVNNMAETYNGYIINARSKHLIYMLEDMRLALMERLTVKMQWMESFQGVICPKVQEKLDKSKDGATACTPVPSSNTEFQVKYGLDELAVDIQKRTCTCRKWDLTGIPCCHAVSCILFLRLNAEDFVADCYRRNTYLRCYASKIAPLVGERHWPVVDTPLEPPPVNIGPWRPKKNRRMDPHEDPKRPGKLTRHGFKLKCSNCHSTAHTKRKCPAPVNEIAEAPKRKRGRPSKQPTGGVRTDGHHTATAQPSNGGRGRGRGRERGRNRSRGANNGRGRSGEESVAAQGMGYTMGQMASLTSMVPQ